MQNIDTIDKLRKENETRSIVAKIILGFLNTVYRYLGLNKLVNKVQNILKDRRLANGLAARPPLRREIRGNIHRTRGLLSFANRLREARTAKIREAKAAGKAREAAESIQKIKEVRIRDRDRKLNEDKSKILEKDSLSTKKALEDYRKIDNILAKSDGFEDLKERAGILREATENTGKLDLKTKLDQEISNRQLANDFSNRITKEMDLFNRVLSHLINFAERLTGLDINRDGKIADKSLEEHRREREERRSGRVESAPTPRASGVSSGQSSTVSSPSDGNDDSLREIKERYTPNTTIPPNESDSSTPTPKSSALQRLGQRTKASQAEQSSIPQTQQNIPSNKPKAPDHSSGLGRG